MRSVRRVVTGFNGTGKSCVISDGDAPLSVGSVELWMTDRDHPLGSDPGPGPHALEPARDGTRWRIYEVPPDTVTREYFKRSIPGYDAEGVHCTNTVDYILILEGAITLELEDGSVDLMAGDCVVQRHTNHAWRNHGDQPVRMLCSMVSIDQTTK